MFGGRGVFTDEGLPIDTKQEDGSYKVEVLKISPEQVRSFNVRGDTIFAVDQFGEFHVTHNSPEAMALLRSAGFVADEELNLPFLNSEANPTWQENIETIKDSERRRVVEARFQKLAGSLGITPVNFSDSFNFDGTTIGSHPEDQFSYGITPGYKDVNRIGLIGEANAGVGIITFVNERGHLMGVRDTEENRRKVKAAGYKFGNWDVPRPGYPAGNAVIGPEGKVSEYEEFINGR